MTPGQAESAAQELAVAEEALEEGRLLLEAAHRSGAASRLYYAAFHAARSALRVRGLNSKTHSGLIFLFEETFGPRPVLRVLFEMRTLADYTEEPIQVSQTELESKLNDTREFLSFCRGIVEQALAQGPDESDPPPDW